MACRNLLQRGLERLMVSYRRDIWSISSQMSRMLAQVTGLPTAGTIPAERVSFPFCGLNPFISFISALLSSASGWMQSAWGSILLELVCIQTTSDPLPSSTKAKTTKAERRMSLNLSHANPHACNTQFCLCGQPLARMTFGGTLLWKGEWV